MSASQQAKKGGVVFASVSLRLARNRGLQIPKYAHKDLPAIDNVIMLQVDLIVKYEMYGI